jgi:hypothetical protein
MHDGGAAEEKASTHVVTTIMTRAPNITKTLPPLKIKVMLVSPQVFPGSIFFLMLRLTF